MASAVRRVADFVRIVLLGDCRAAMSCCFKCLSKLRLRIASQRRVHAETSAVSTGNEAGRDGWKRVSDLKSSEGARTSTTESEDAQQNRMSAVHCVSELPEPSRRAPSACLDLISARLPEGRLAGLGQLLQLERAFSTTSRPHIGAGTLATTGLAAGAGSAPCQFSGCPIKWDESGQPCESLMDAISEASAECFEAQYRRFKRRSTHSPRTPLTRIPFVVVSIWVDRIVLMSCALNIGAPLRVFPRTKDVGSENLSEFSLRAGCPRCGMSTEPSGWLTVSMINRGRLMVAAPCGIGEHSVQTADDTVCTVSWLL